MFSLQAHNQQILFYLSQITPRRQTIRLKGQNSHKKLKKSSNAVQNELASMSCADLNKLCTDSLAEVVRNFAASPNASILELPLNAIASKKWSSKPSHRTTNRLDSLEAKLKTSYVSHASFQQNKSESMYGPLGAAVVTPTAAGTNQFVLVANLVGQLNQPSFVRHLHQIRGFRTQRAIEAQSKRNPTFLSRLQELFAPTIKNDPAVLAAATNPNHRNEALNKLLLNVDNTNNNNNNLQPGDQKVKIKVAFAEGYLAANNSAVGKTGVATKFLKMLMNGVVIVCVAIMITFLTATNGNSIIRISLSSQAEVNPEEINETFDDVKGCDEAKQELSEIVEFLKHPEKFSTLGGKLPKGILLVGPPGTGKTLLARAVAGEAGVPFYHAAGAEFDEVLVGQGARRVRDLFKAAKERAPCVIFIDEIDAVGAKRTSSTLHPYANQTINQLLSEMDGFHQNEGVIVLGATNRREDLDQALLRPGRFDVQVTVPIPDYTGRQEIISLYLEKILHKDVDIQLLARGTTGFTGADLENMINQAALRAAIDGAEVVLMKHLESARDKVLMGPERKSRLPDEEANEITAYHEAGHAIVGYYTKESSSLHKVTIMPRGASLGHTAYMPKKERYHVTKAQLLAMMDTAMGGRAAEELIFGPEKITSGASNDLKHATSIANNMVKEWGMSDKVGLRTIEEPKDYRQADSLGPNTTEIIDAEIKKILTESYERAKSILKNHAKEHKALAEALLKYETLDADDIKAILTGDEPN